MPYKPDWQKGVHETRTSYGPYTLIVFKQSTGNWAYNVSGPGSSGGSGFKTEAAAKTFALAEAVAIAAMVAAAAVAADKAVREMLDKRIG